MTSKSALRIGLVLVPVVAMLVTAPLIGSQVEFFVWVPSMGGLIVLAVLIYFIVERRGRRD